MLAAAMTFDLNSTKTVAALALGLMSSIILGLSLGLSPPAGWFSRLMELLGDASYSIYLIHVLVILIFLQGVVALAPNANPYLVHAGVIALAIIAGVMVHMTVEKRVVLKSRQIFRGLRIIRAEETTD